MPRTADEIINDIGMEKSSTKQRRKTYDDDTKQKIKKICRVVMRYPSTEILEQLEYIRQRMNEEFSTMPDEALSWLIDGSSQNSRGGFQEGPHKTAIQKFKDFLIAPSGTIPPQRLITGIETIATAMAYRGVCLQWGKPPFQPQTYEQVLMYKKIRKFLNKTLVMPIGNVYTTRAQDLLSDLAISTSYQEVTIGRQEDVSSASEAEEEEQKQKEIMKSRVFRKNLDSTNLTWVGNAEKRGLQVRAHVSGTGPLILATIEGLCSSGTGSRKNWLEDDINLKSLAGVLIIPTFQRGDYHSIAETGAGVHHYLTERNIKRGKYILNTPLNPSDAFENAMSMLVAGSSSAQARNEDNLSIKEAIEITTQTLVAHAENSEDYRLTYGPLNKLHETQQLEELVRKMMENTPFRIEEIKGEDYFIFEDGTQFNWKEIQAKADLQHVDFYQTDFNAYKQYLESDPFDYVQYKGYLGSNAKDLDVNKETYYRDELYKDPTGKALPRPDTPMSFQEMQAIRIYTTPFFREMNGLMQDNSDLFDYKKCTDLNKVRRALVHSVMAASGLRRVPIHSIPISYRYESYSGSDKAQEKLKDLVAAAAKKEIISLKGLISSSTDKDATRRYASKGGLLYTFENLRGAYIAPISTAPYQEEFLIPATQLQILGYKFNYHTQLHEFKSSMVSELGAMDVKANHQDRSKQSMHTIIENKIFKIFNAYLKSNEPDEYLIKELFNKCKKTADADYLINKIKINSTLCRAFGIDPLKSEAERVSDFNDLMERAHNNIALFSVKTPSISPKN